MVFNLFFRNSRKNEIEIVKEEIKNSFSNVKSDMDKISQWITHLHRQSVAHKSDVYSIIDDLSSVKNELSELKDLVASLTVEMSERVFTTPINSKRKQTAVGGVQTPVQTPVQTANFYGISNLSVSERTIVWLLANSELKLSYDDLAAMLGKNKSTVRGQINSVKQKSEGLILEVIERNGLKRVYMPQEIREKLLKKSKVRVRKGTRG